MKKIFALIGAILLIGLYLITFILAILNDPRFDGALKAAIYTTVVLPILLYAYIMIYKYLKNKD